MKNAIAIVFFALLVFFLLLPQVRVGPSDRKVNRTMNAVGSGEGKVARAMNDVDVLVAAAQAYIREYGDNPKGDSPQVLNILQGHNPRKIVFLEIDPQSLSKNGGFLDPWGSEYVFDFSNTQFPWAYSRGKDKIDEGGHGDDIASWNSPDFSVPDVSGHSTDNSSANMSIRTMLTTLESQLKAHPEYIPTVARDLYLEPSARKLAGVLAVYRLGAWSITQYKQLDFILEKIIYGLPEKDVMHYLQEIEWSHSAAAQTAALHNLARKHKASPPLGIYVYFLKYGQDNAVKYAAIYSTRESASMASAPFVATSTTSPSLFRTLEA